MAPVVTCAELTAATAVATDRGRGPRSSRPGPRVRCDLPRPEAQRSAPGRRPSGGSGGHRRLAPSEPRRPQRGGAAFEAASGFQTLLSVPCPRCSPHDLPRLEGKLDYSYDAPNGLVTSLDEAVGQGLSYTYDEAGNRTAMRWGGDRRSTTGEDRTVRCRLQRKGNAFRLGRKG